MKVVCIGGGTGLSQTVKAWRELGASITAIVATTDNGGCSGRLREAGSPVPWGDIRKVLLALADPQDAFGDMLSLRYANIDHLKKHCVGNLLLEAAYQQHQSVEGAIAQISALLNVEHKVIAMSDTPVQLLALKKDGQILRGETQIDALEDMPHHLFLDNQIEVSAECLDAIANADVVTLGPGSLMTSVMPVLLVPAIQQALSVNKGINLLLKNLRPEQSPVSQLTEEELAQWISGQIDFNIIDAEMNGQLLCVDNTKHDLPQSLTHQNGVHDIKPLAKGLAFAFLTLSRQHPSGKRLKGANCQLNQLLEGRYV